MENRAIAKHGYYIIDEDGNSTKVDKETNTDVFGITPHIDYIVRDFVKFLEVSGYSSVTVKERLSEVLDEMEEV